MDKYKRLAIIPARGGSKRIPGKNIRNFCGKPMILHTLESARDSEIFDEIHVSTDSDTIADIADKAGFATKFMRPGSLADDQTPIMPVLKYVLEAYAGKGKNFSQVWMLMACSPLIEASDYVSAAKLFDDHQGKSPLLGIAEYPVPVEWAFSLSNIDNSLTPVNPGMFSMRSQDIEKKYFDAGAFSAFPADQIRQSKGAGQDKEFIGYVLDKSRVIDIDDEEDWKAAELLYRSLSGRK